MDLTSSRNKISLAETQYLSGLNESLSTRLGAAVNWIIDNISNQAIGTVVHSMMTLPQFQAVKGTGWVLANGQAVPLTLYATQIAPNVPDMRSRYLRGKNNGGSPAGTRSDGNQNPAGDLALGTLQATAFSSHSHSASFDNFNNPNKFNLAKSDQSLDTDSDSYVWNRNPFLFTPTINITGAISGVSTISTEEIPITRIVNFFIRVN